MKKQPQADLIKVFWRAISSIWKSTPLLFTLMILLGIVQGIAPTISIIISKWIVDGIAQIQSEGYEQIYKMAIAWAAVA